jgi:hypothetical protein
MPDVGRKAEGEHTQSVLFAKAAGWTKASSRRWCKDHDYYTDGYDETGESIRWRQYDPDSEKFRYRSKVVEENNGKPSVTLVLGFPAAAAAQEEGEHEMSLGKEIARAEAKIKELDARLAEDDAAKTALQSEIGALKSAAEAAAAESTRALAAATAEIERLKADGAAQVAAAAESMKAKEAELAQARADLEKAQADIAEAKQRLENPAFQAAAAAGETEPVKTSGAEEAKTGLWAKYYEITDPAERSRFYDQHRAELIAEIQAQK